MALESRQQGGSFLSITRTAWPHAALDAAHQRLAGEIALPVAVALAAAAHGIALERALGGYLHAFTANLISAALRTVPLGQTDGQMALAALEGAVRRSRRGGARGRLARRGRHGDAAARLVLDAPRNPVHAAVPLMTDLLRSLAISPCSWRSASAPLPSCMPCGASAATWPEASEEALARSVVGDGRRRMPPPWQCFAVATVLVAMALWPWYVLGRASDPVVLAGSFAIAGLFVARGIAGYSPRWRGRFTTSRLRRATGAIIRRICLLMRRRLSSRLLAGELEQQ